METKKELDIKLMSKELGISIPEIKTLLGIPLDGVCDATTAEDAEKMFDECQPKTEKQVICFKKWVELTSSFEGAMKIIQKAPDYLGLVYIPSNKAIELLDTMKEVLDLDSEISVIFFNDYEEDLTDEEKALYSAFMNKWLKIYNRDFDKEPTNFDEAIEKYLNAPDMPNRFTPSEKLTRFYEASYLAKTLEDYSVLNFYKPYNIDPVMDNIFNEEMNLLALDRANSASNFKDAYYVLKNSLEGSESEKVSLQKCLEFQRTEIETESLMEFISGPDEMNRRQSLKSPFFIEKIASHIYGYEL